MSSDDRGEVTPVPMPNTEVKLSSADDSWGLSPCESRTSLGSKAFSIEDVFFVFQRKEKEA
jgi:hypothetical protein